MTDSPSVVPHDDAVCELIESLVEFDQELGRWFITVAATQSRLAKIAKDVASGRNLSITQAARSSARKERGDKNAERWARQYRKFENAPQYFNLSATNRKAMVGRRHPPEGLRALTSKSHAVEVIDRGLVLIEANRAGKWPVRQSG